MSIPVRNLAKYGIVTDPDPFDLPVGAWSFGVNARFRNGRVTRAPVFRNVRNLGTSNPRYLVANTPTAGLDNIFVGYEDGTVTKITPSGETSYSYSGWTPSAAEAVWTSCHLGNVLYINREDRIPWYARTSDSAFQQLPTAASPVGWDSTWRCHLLRSVSSSLIALNVTKGATNYPTMIKTSSFTQVNTTPTSWDNTDPSTNATENTLAELEGPITDACALRNDLYIYGLNETWLMREVGGTDVWDYFKVFDNRGSISANCSIEVLGKQYIFGPDDIWCHDGITPTSICDGTVRDFIFSSLNASKAYRFFVAHNPILKEIQFCYVSGDRGVSFMNADGCNRQAVFNYSTLTWTFDDLPFVYSSTQANLANSETYASATQTYANIGGSYLDQEDGYKKTQCYVGDTNATYGLTKSLYAFDLYGPGSTVSFAVDTNATKGMYLERDGIDLDELGIDLPGYKTINSMYPECRIDSTAQPLIITSGASDFYGVPASPIETQSYDGMSLYKCDFNAAGRYLWLSLTFNDYKYISVSGFDLDIQVTGER